jgi:hypothetical protein
MTPNQLSICLIEDFDPEEVEAVAYAGMDTDRTRLNQLLQALLGDYPTIINPSITYNQVSDPIWHELVVDIRLEHDPNRTSTFGISNFIYDQGKQIGIEFRSSMGSNCWNSDKNPASAWFTFVMTKETRAPLDGEQVLGESETDPEEIENLVHSVYGKRHWVEMESSMYPWEQGGIWWDSVNNEMVVVRENNGESCNFVFKFKVEPIESYSFVDIGRVLYDLDMPQEEWDHKDNLHKVATVARMYDYSDLFDPNPKWMTKRQLRQLLVGIPIP